MRIKYLFIFLFTRPFDRDKCKIYLTTNKILDSSNLCREDENSIILIHD